MVARVIHKNAQEIVGRRIGDVPQVPVVGNQDVACGTEGIVLRAQRIALPDILVRHIDPRFVGLHLDGPDVEVFLMK